MASPPSFPFYVRTVKATWNFCSIRLLPSSLVLHSSLRAKISPLPPPFLLLRARCYQALKKSGETRILTNLLLLPTLAMPPPPLFFPPSSSSSGAIQSGRLRWRKERGGPEGGGLDWKQGQRDSFSDMDTAGPT